MSESQEHVLDETTWPAEAEAAINDIKKHVKGAKVSESVSSSNQRIYINLTTLEGAPYCVEMSASGFRIVGKRHDDTSLSEKDGTTFETPYALLNVISQKYKESFGGELMSKLMELAKKEEG
ncbi:hypothetical protein O0L34_g4756 [Tuta absoluta]|nr:hypothetical protein O0L34_g4756 [Tuta absoluta]